MPEETFIHVPRENKNLKVAESFCEQFPGLVYCEEDNLFFIYDNGYYRPLSRLEIHTFIIDHCKNSRAMSDGNQKHLLNQIARIKRRPLSEYNTGDYINFINGLYSVKTHTLKPHDPQYLSTIRIPYEYNPEAKCFLWLKTLEEIFGTDHNPIRTLHEFFGYCFMRNTKMHKALLLIGLGATGKSTIAQVLRNLIGTDNTAALSLRYFNDHTMIGTLKNKYANIVEEIPKKIEDYESEFCNVVSGGEVQVNPKYLNPYKFYPFCKILFACNKFPHIDDDTNAFYRRLLILRMDKIFKEEEQNKDLPEQLRDELPGIFNLAMTALRRLNKRGYFAIDEYMKKEIDYLQESNNPIRTYLKENIMVLKDMILVKSEAYEHYKNWCLASGYRAMGLAKFAADVYMTYRNYTKSDVREGTGERRYIWPNLAFRTKENEILGNQGNIGWDNE